MLAVSVVGIGTGAERKRHLVGIAKVIAVADFEIEERRRNGAGRGQIRTGQDVGVGRYRSGQLSPIEDFDRLNFLRLGPKPTLPRKPGGQRRFQDRQAVTSHEARPALGHKVERRELFCRVLARRFGACSGNGSGFAAAG